MGSVEVHAVSGMSFDIEEGELSASGAGKTIVYGHWGQSGWRVVMSRGLEHDLTLCHDLQQCKTFRGRAYEPDLHGPSARLLRCLHLASGQWRRSGSPEPSSLCDELPRGSRRALPGTTSTRSDPRARGARRERRETNIRRGRGLVGWPPLLFTKSVEEHPRSLGRSPSRALWPWAAGFGRPPDVRATADRWFDGCNIYDLRMVSRARRRTSSASRPPRAHGGHARERPPT